MTVENGHQKDIFSKKKMVANSFFLTTLGYVGSDDSFLRNISSPLKDRRGSYTRKKVGGVIIETHIKVTEKGTVLAIITATIDI